MTSTVEAKKAFNLGTSVSTKAFGEVEVFEFCVDDLFTLSDQISELVKVLMTLEAVEPDKIVGHLLQNKTIQKTLKTVIACAIQKKPSELEGIRIPLGDAGAILKAIMEQNDWEVWKQNFSPVLAVVKGFSSTTQTPTK